MSIILIIKCAYYILSLFYFGKCKTFLGNFVSSYVISQDPIFLFLTSYILKSVNSTKGIFRNTTLIFGKGHLCWNLSETYNNNDQHWRSPCRMPDTVLRTFIPTYSNPYNLPGRCLLAFPFLRCQLWNPRETIIKFCWLGEAKFSSLTAGRGTPLWQVLVPSWKSREGYVQDMESEIKWLNVIFPMRKFIGTGHSLWHNSSKLEDTAWWRF